MKRVGFVYDDIFLKHDTPQWHPETKERLKAIVAKLRETGVWDGVEIITPRKAEFKDVEAVHTPQYVQMIKGSSPGYLDPDTFLSEESLTVALFAAGAVIEGIKSCRDGQIDSVFCAVRPPGHHAEADRAMGFCIFNNIAVGAKYAQRIGYKKVFIADFDVHHGNGTQHIFYEDDTVFYFSTHQYPHYPGTGSTGETGRGKGKGYTCNIPMSTGAGDQEYNVAYNETLHETVRKFDPDIFLVSAGYDIHSNDPLAGIRVSDDGVKTIVRGILSSKKDIPYIFVLEGGYDLEALGTSIVLTLKEMIKDE